MIINILHRTTFLSTWSALAGRY